MGIDSVNQLSNEQLLAMNIAGNGQTIDDTSSTSDDTNVAFQLMLENLKESSKNSKQKDVSSTGNKETNVENSDSKNINNTSNDKRVAQTYAAGQKLEDIPMIVSGNYINLSNNSASAISNESGADIDKIYNAVDSAAKKYGVDPKLILAIIRQESDFDTNSTSETGAKGLMQIMPENFSNLGITNGYDVNQNINGGTKLFKEYLDQYNGNTEMALMAYNGGPGTMQRRGVSSSGDLYKMPKETQNYVPKVMGYYRN